MPEGAEGVETEGEGDGMEGERKGSEGRQEEMEWGQRGGEGEGGGKVSGKLIESSETEELATRENRGRERMGGRGKSRGRRRKAGGGRGSGRERRRKRGSEGEGSPAPSGEVESRPPEEGGANSEELSLEDGVGQPVERDGLDDVMDTVEQGASEGGVSNEGVQNESLTECVTENEGTGHNNHMIPLPTKEMEVREQAEVEKKEEEEKGEEVKEEEFGGMDGLHIMQLEFSSGRKRRRDTFSLSLRSDPLSLGRRTVPSGSDETHTPSPPPVLPLRATLLPTVQDRREDKHTASPPTQVCCCQVGPSRLPWLLRRQGRRSKRGVRNRPPPILF